MALSGLITVLCFLGVTFAAPSRLAQSIYETSKISQYFELMENICNHLTFKACGHRDGYMFRYSVYDPVSDFCVCAATPSAILVNQKCGGTACPADRPSAYYWPHMDGCFCETEDFFAKPWNYVLPGNEPADITATKSIFDTQHNELILEDIWGQVGSSDNHSDKRLTFHTWTALAMSVLKHKMVDTLHPSCPVKEDQKIRKRQSEPSATSTLPAVDTAVPTFVPPPKQNITGALINQSLSVQPQNTATVGSVIPYLIDGVITYLVQLDGIVANTIPMNASTTFPCGTVGTDPQPNIMLVPKYIQQGAQQTINANCRCIAANMYDPEVITYWIQNDDGSIFSLVGSNKVFDIDKIDTSAPIALNLMTTPSGATKREDTDAVAWVEVPRRQVLQVRCDRPCLHNTEAIPSSDAQCGCLAKAAILGPDLAGRGLNVPDAFSATMTNEACKAMTCINNGNKPALFNPFSLTCWCADPGYIEDNASAWTGNVAKY